ncbi:MAG: hypothetical protein ACRD11_14550 [Terriglobia bacterium]
MGVRALNSEREGRKEDITTDFGRGTVAWAIALVWLLAACPPSLARGAGKSGEAKVCDEPGHPPPRSYASFFGRQLPIVGESPEWALTLVGWDPQKWPARRFSFRLENKRTGSSFPLKFSAWASPPPALKVDQIDQIDIVDDTRALVLGRSAANFSEAAIIQLPSGRLLDQFLCLMPLVSPDHRFLAYVKPFPGHPGPVDITNEYIVYDLTTSPSANRIKLIPGVAYDAGIPVYPPGATNAAGEFIAHSASSAHVIASRGFFWLGRSDTLAFIDRWEGVNRLVLADVGAGVRGARVTVRPLSTSIFVNLSGCQRRVSASDFKNWSSHPASLVDVTDIQICPAKPGCLRLCLYPQPCLATTSVDVQVVSSPAGSRL